MIRCLKIIDEEAGRMPNLQGLTEMYTYRLIFCNSSPINVEGNNDILW